MTKNDILEFLKTHKDELKRNFGLHEIGLFGSYAKDMADENSDIDIVIKSKKKYIDSFREYYKSKIEKNIIYV